MPKSVENHWHQFTDSSNILGAGVKDGKLIVAYHKDGRPTGVYAYTTDDIKKGTALCCRMALAISKGAFANQYIRPLPYARIG